MRRFRRGRERGFAAVIDGMIASDEPACPFKPAACRGSRPGPDWQELVAELPETLQSWPWLDTMRTLARRFREDRLGITASSLTFTTLISLVPLITVMLAVFSAFPIFNQFQGSVQQYLLQSLIPDNIAKPVLGGTDPVRKAIEPARRRRAGGAGLHRAGLDADDRPHAEQHLAGSPAAADRAARAGLLGRIDPWPGAARRQPDADFVCAVGVAGDGRSDARRNHLPAERGRIRACSRSALPACSTTCRIPRFAGGMRWPAASSSRSVSNWPSAG